MSRIKTKTLQLESLEDRRTMAGNVGVEYTADRVTVRGDNASNNIAIVSDKDGNITVHNSNGSTNGKSSATQFKLKGRELWVDAGGGNDTIKVQGHDKNWIYTGKLTILADSLGGRNGEDTVSVDKVFAYHNNGVSLINTGSENFKDSVSVKNFLTYHNLGIATGGGNDTVKMEKVELGRTLEVNLGAGNDSLSRIDTFFTDGILDGGSGNDQNTRRGGTAAKTVRNF